MRTSRARSVVIALALAALAGSASAQSEVPSPAPSGEPKHCRACGAARTAVRDARDVITSPHDWHSDEWRSAGIKAALVGGAMLLVDRPLRDAAQRRRNAASDRLASAFEPFGERYAAGVLLGFWLAGRVGDAPAAKRVAVDGAESIVIASGLIVPALKLATGRSRPRADLGAADFAPFHGGESFPSGHTAAAFALAASIAANDDDLWVKGLAYGVASLVAYARIDHDAHFASDVLAGGFIGVGVARRVAALDHHRRGIAFAPVSTRDGWGIAVAKAF